MTGPWSARVVLTDPTVEAAVLETARGGILREGLGWDRCDVGCVLNVSADHLGLARHRDGRGSRLRQAPRRRGRARRTARVLNADDPLVAAMAERAEGRIMYFSLLADESARRHVKGRAAAAPRWSRAGRARRDAHDLRRRAAHPGHVDAPHPGDARGQGEVQRRERARRGGGLLLARRLARAHPPGAAHLHDLLLPGARAAATSSTSTRSASSSTTATTRRRSRRWSTS